jgi:hypothetical protein
MARWRKNGGPARDLPDRDQDEAGSVWTDLANSPDARAACGWAPAGTPDQVSLAGFRIALIDAGLAEAFDAWLEAQPAQAKAYWRSTPYVRPGGRLAAAAAGLGLSAGDVDELLFAAEAAE